MSKADTGRPFAAILRIWDVRLLRVDSDFRNRTRICIHRTGERDTLIDLSCGREEWSWKGGFIFDSNTVYSGEFVHLKHDFVFLMYGSKLQENFNEFE